MKAPEPQPGTHLETHLGAAALPSVHGPIRGAVSVPGSKSLTNRALLVAALAEGASELTGALFSDDTRYMAAALQLVGVGLEIDSHAHTVRVQGRGAGPGPAAEGIFTGNAGTATRFLTSYFTLGEGEYRIDGLPRMRERPIEELVEALRQLGAAVEAAPSGCPPVTIRGGGLRGGRCQIPGKRSSQFLSSVLLSAPYARGPVEAEVVGELASQPYVDLTAQVMAAFGVELENDNYQRFRVAPARYRGCQYVVEPDVSAASYFLGAAAVTGGEVTVRGLQLESPQADIAFARILEQMGCELAQSSTGLTVRGGSDLRGVDVDMSRCSDVALTLAAVAPFASTPTHIRNIEHTRVQETDRIHAIVTELRRAGLEVEERRDGFTVHPGQPQPTVFETYEDHRMAMSLALIGLRTPGCAVINPDCVSKTFPEFFEVLGRLVRGA